MPRSYHQRQRPGCGTAEPHARAIVKACALRVELARPQPRRQGEWYSSVNRGRRALLEGSGWIRWLGTFPLLSVVRAGEGGPIPVHSEERVHLAKFFQMSAQNGEAGDEVEVVREPRRMALENNPYKN